MNAWTAAFNDNEPVVVVIRPEDIDLVAPRRETHHQRHGCHSSHLHGRALTRSASSGDDGQRMAASIRRIIAPKRGRAGGHHPRAPTIFTSWSRSQYDARGRIEEDSGMKKKHFALPYIVWMILFTVVPLLLIVVYAVFNDRRTAAQFVFDRPTISPPCSRPRTCLFWRRSLVVCAASPRSSACSIAYPAAHAALAAHLPGGRASSACCLSCPCG